ncbi:hypothetical protein K432DRAFT_357268 [Lepidopterella palustris CBS 459.81]|uniref:Pentatricopeptide repeat protein n=1 Tax=Lepidopterella palustris CBS 459.81 TaxID=1314670 RepID=A0A8E2E691_9PEZI|nr:hypothetical protein K432DRAFT_357268 [Lepidopterella palustris CBS 459.81]
MSPKLSVICPLAPFLIPFPARIALRKTPQIFRPLLCSNAYAIHTKSSRASSKYLTRIKRAKEKAYIKYHLPLVPEDEGPEDSLGAFRRNLYSGDLDNSMKLYPDLVEKSLLQSFDTLAIAKLLHSSYRNYPIDKRHQDLDSKYLSFAETLIQDLRSRKLPPECAAHIHLISFFKISRQYDKGYNFWTWLVRQQDTYINAAVYGAAIEMLAYQGIAPLQELEEMYSQALKRFPGTFAEYHLSPDAIVVDKAQPTSIAGLPMSLLQGILTARLLHGEWRASYIALDTALRLYPTQVPARLLEMFALERPISESYTAFLMACRGGIVLKSNRLTGLLNRLKDAQFHRSMEDKLTLLRGMVTAMHAYLGAGGTLSGYHLSSLITGFSGLLPSRLSVTPFGPEATEATGLIVSTTRKVVAVLLQSCIQPSVSTFGSLIGLAGKAKIPALVEQTVKEMAAFKLEPDDVIHRITLSAAGDAEDAQLVESRWKSLVEFANTKGRPLSASDWRCLAVAVKRTQHMEYLHEQIETLSHTITDELKEKINAQLFKERILEPAYTVDKIALAFHLEMILNQIQQLVELFKSGRILDFHLSPIPMFLDPAHRALGSVEDLRAVYDELNTDPLQPRPSPSNPTITATGIPFDELRFENWVSIHTLMDDAESVENEKRRLVDEAIAAGMPVPKQNYDFGIFRRLTSDQNAEAHGTYTVPSKAELRERILKLRGTKAAV